MHLTKPISAFAELFPHLQNLNWARPVALAVSGGGDSMAMLATVVDYRRALKLRSPLLVLTVDHGLRSEAAREAEMVRNYCDKRAIYHETLIWSGAKPTSAVAENARNIRRNLLLEACHQRGIHQLVLAHTKDDVAETLLMRVRRGGLRGHASIPVQTRIMQTIIHRPFLELRRSTLRAALRRAGTVWIDDPTNDDIRYERPRVRQTLRQLESTDCDTERIAAYAKVMGRFRKVLSDQISQVLLRACTLEGCDLHIDARVLKQYPRMVGLEALRELVRLVGGDTHMINRNQAALAFENLVSHAERPKNFSAGRCVVFSNGDGKWTVSRAIRALPIEHISGGQSIRWDGRYMVRFFGKPDEIATILPHSNSPKVMPDTAKCEISFRPQVLDGPVSCLDEAIFQSFSALLEPAIS